MKLKAQTIETEEFGFQDTEQFSMETTDPAVIQIMLENIYPDPYVWPRELLSNWADAGGGGELILPTVLEPSWVIEDTGDGMTDEFMRGGYSKIFHSTKRNDDSARGGFGHGRLSPLAYTDSFSVRSRFMQDGVIMEGNYLVYKGENKIPRVTPLSLAPSEVQQTGVTVTIPIGDKDIKRITDRTMFFASYLPQQPKGFKPVEYLFKNAIGGVRAKGQDSDMSGVRLIVGGVPYPVPRAAGLSPAIPFDLFFEVGDMQPTLDRGSINGDDKTLTKIKLHYKQLIDDYKAGAMKIIDAEPTVLDRYAKYMELASVLEYSIRNTIFGRDGFAKPSSLDTKLIFDAAKDDFNLHEVHSDIDRVAWRDLDIETKSLKSLVGIKIKSLIGHGSVQRKSGADVSSSTVIEFANYVQGQQPQIAIFAIKLPYIQGQIKLIKEAVAAELAKQRQASPATLGKNVKVLLIQYESEDDVKAIAKLISPKLPVTFITDSSKRSSGSQYLSVIVAQANSYSTTKAVRVKALNDDSTMLFFVRPITWNAYKTNSVLDYLRRLPIFKDRKLVAVNKSDESYLPANYPTIEDTLLKYIVKQGYPIDEQVTTAHLTKANAEAMPLDAGLLKYRAIGTDPHKHKRVWEVVETNAKLMADPVLKGIVEAAKTDSKLDTKSIAEINSFAGTMSFVKGHGFFTKPIPKLNRPLPTIQTKDRSVLEKFSKRFPMIEVIRNANDYNFRNYGLDNKTLDAVIDYFEVKQAN